MSLAPEDSDVPEGSCDQTPATSRLTRIDVQRRDPIAARARRDPRCHLPPLAAPAQRRLRRRRCVPKILGHLITGYLFHEAGSDQGISLHAFWARQVRRALPAACVVPVASLLATVLFLPLRLWEENAKEIGASALGIHHWVLAANSVDYFGVDNTPTLVQNFWSLSLEEQFYVVWPLLLFCVFILRRRRTALGRARAVATVMVIVFVYQRETRSMHSRARGGALLRPVAQLGPRGEFTASHRDRSFRPVLRREAVSRSDWRRHRLPGLPPPERHLRADAHLRSRPGARPPGRLALHRWHPRL
jgi:hypothetical protein